MPNLTTEQLKILSTLLFKPNARFRELNKDKISTDLFSYHLKGLLKEQLIIKSGLHYNLTAQGKMHAGKLDTDLHKLEAQPKVSVLLIPHQLQAGKQVFAVQQRTKEPYFGYWGFSTGKVRFGETLFETAARELNEEMGLKAKFKLCFELHEMVYVKTTQAQLEDKFFHIIEAFDLTGTLMETTKEGINKFVSADDFLELSPIYHNELDVLTWFLKKDFSFKEEKYYIDKF